MRKKCFVRFSCRQLFYRNIEIPKYRYIDGANRYFRRRQFFVEISKFRNLEISKGGESIKTLFLEFFIPVFEILAVTAAFFIFAVFAVKVV